MGTSSSTHIAEEVPNPGRTLPRVMFLTMVIGTLTSFLWAFAFMFAATDLAEIAASKLPVLTLYAQTLNNDGVAVFFIVWLFLICTSMLLQNNQENRTNTPSSDYGAAIGCLVTTGRQTWAFARDNGLPYSKAFARIDPISEAPANATILTAAFCIIYGAIYVGSTTAFNSFVSLAILGLNASYAVPQAVVLLRGRKNVLPERYFDLGPIMGPFCNAFTIAWVAVYTILFCFPVFLPVNLNNMNYLSVVLAGLCLFILVLWWGGKRKTFVGPTINLEVLESLSQTRPSSSASELRNCEVKQELKPAV